MSIFSQFGIWPGKDPYKNHSTCIRVQRKNSTYTIRFIKLLLLLL